MYYALVYYLNEYPAVIDSFREKYDSRFLLTKPHLTFIFPVDATVSQTVIVEHIDKILNSKTSLQITFSGISRSWDNLVFLLTKEGTDKIMYLHDELYSGVLKPFLRPNIEYIPHVTLGSIQSEETLKEAKNLNIHFSSRISSLTLIKRENETSPIIWSKVFALK